MHFLKHSSFADLRVRCGRKYRRIQGAAFFAGLAGFCSPCRAEQTSPPEVSVERLCALHFGKASIESHQLELSESDLDEIVPRLGFSVLEKRFLYCTAKEGRVKEGEVLKGFAFVITRRVRNQDQTALYYVSAKGQIEGIEVLRFHESSEYEAPKEWLNQFIGMQKTDRARVGREVPAITGATFTAQSYLSAAQLALALAERLKPKPAKKKSRSAKSQTLNQKKRK